MSSSLVPVSHSKECLTVLFIAIERIFFFRQKDLFINLYMI